MQSFSTSELLIYWFFFSVSQHAYDKIPDVFRPFFQVGGHISKMEILFAVLFLIFKNAYFMRLCFPRIMGIIDRNCDGLSMGYGIALQNIEAGYALFYLTDQAESVRKRFLPVAHKYGWNRVISDIKCFSSIQTEI